MIQWRRIGLLLWACCAFSIANAQEQARPFHEITFEQALELARKRAPQILTARARVAEAEARVAGASVWPYNPQILGEAGPRFRDSDVAATDWSVGLQQWIQLGGQGGHRRAAARAGLEAESARSDNVERLLLHEVGDAFASALYWQRRVDLAEENLDVAREVSRIAEQSYGAGDVGRLDVSIGALGLARAESEVARAAVEEARASAELNLLLGIDDHPPLRAVGDLLQLGRAVPTGAVDIDARPDIRALIGEKQEAEADVELGRAARIPDVALGASYIYDQGDDIALASVTVELPVFDHGQAAVAAATARRSTIEAQLAEARRAASIEIDTDGAAAATLSRAAEGFARSGGLDALRKAEEIATTSYEAGAIPLGELLSVRREVALAKLDYADLMLAVALARIDLAASAGDLK